MKKTFRNSILVVLILFFASVAVLSGREAFGIYIEHRKGADAYQELAQYMTMDGTPQETPVPVRDDGAETESAPEPTPQINFPQVDFDSLREINDDVVAWLYCEGTAICHPVVQTYNNDYYLYYLFDKRENIMGCPFVDYENSPDFVDPNTIIYGHHMNDERQGMFADLVKYKDQAYYDEHPIFLLITPEKNYVIRIFAGYVAETTQDCWRQTFIGRKDFKEWIDNNIALSCFKSDVVPTDKDRIVTLSTCDYDFKDARFVLYGVLEEH